MRSGFLVAGEIGPVALAGAGRWYTAGGAPVPLIAYQPKGASSLAASYVNLANPGTYDAAPIGTPTFATATGWTFPSAYLTTGYLMPGTQAATILIRYSNASQVSNGLGILGAAGPGAYRTLITAFKTGGVLEISHNDIKETGTAAAAGVIGFAGTAAYFNGANVGTIGTRTTAAYTYDLWIGRWNASGSPASSYSGDISAIVIYNSTLTAAQVAAVSAAMAAL